MLKNLTATMTLKKGYLRILCVYWLVLPLLFLVYLLVTANLKQVIIFEALQQEPLLAVMLLISLISIFSSLYLMQLPEGEMERQLQGGRFLKFALIQQLCVGNLAGVALCLLSLRQMPVGTNKGSFKQGSLLTLIIFESALTFIAVFALIMLARST